MEGGDVGHPALARSASVKDATIASGVLAEAVFPVLWVFLQATPNMAMMIRIGKVFIVVLI